MELTATLGVPLLASSGEIGESDAAEPQVAASFAEVLIAMIASVRRPRGDGTPGAVAGDDPVSDRPAAAAERASSGPSQAVITLSSAAAPVGERSGPSPTVAQHGTTQSHATTQPATTQPATTQPATTQPATTQPAESFRHPAGEGALGPSVEPRPIDVAPRPPPIRPDDAPRLLPAPREATRLIKVPWSESAPPPVERNPAEIEVTDAPAQETARSPRLQTDSADPDIRPLDPQLIDGGPRGAIEQHPVTALAEPLGARALERAIAAQVVDRVGRFTLDPDGAHEVTIEIDPAELGRVELRVRLEAGVVHVHLDPHGRATADLLRQSLPELRDALQEAGLQAGALDIGDHREHAQHPSDGSRHRAGDPAVGAEHTHGDHRPHRRAHMTLGERSHHPSSPTGVDVLL